MTSTRLTIWVLVSLIILIEVSGMAYLATSERDDAFAVASALIGLPPVFLLIGVFCIKLAELRRKARRNRRNKPEKDPGNP